MKTAPIVAPLLHLQDQLDHLKHKARMAAEREFRRLFPHVTAHTRNRWQRQVFDEIHAEERDKRWPHIHRLGQKIRRAEAMLLPHLAAAGRYHWNEHGVCTNPSKINIPFPKSHRTTAQVLVAQLADGRWSGSYDIRQHNGGASGLPSLNETHWRRLYATREAAIAAMLDHIEDHLAGDHFNKPQSDRAADAVRVFKRVRKAAADRRMRVRRPVQRGLFASMTNL